MGCLYPDELPKTMRSLVAIALALSAALSGSCGGSQNQAASPVARDTATIQGRLTSGPWRLADYRPDVSLEPMLQAMLGAQIRTMVVSFDGRTLSAQSPTVQVTRPYAVENAAGLQFDLVSPDLQGGGTMRSRCELGVDGRRITFHAQTDPWTGSGVLEREGP
jgi:hypothetical protein